MRVDPFWSAGALERRLAAIVLADIVGYSHLMGDDEAATLTAVAALRSSIIDPAVEAAFMGVAAGPLALVMRCSKLERLQ